MRLPFGRQLIAAALIMGVLMFLGVVLVAPAGKFDGEPDTMTFIAAGFTFLMLVSHFVIPPIILKTQLKLAIAAEMNQKPDDEKTLECCGVYQTS